MSSILVYALHYDGAFNKNSLGAVSEGARLAAELGREPGALGHGAERVLVDRAVVVQRVNQDVCHFCSVSP